MAVAGNEVDANFFNLIHKALGDQQTRRAAQRRESDRAPFPALQRIAIRQGRGVPDESEFFEVQCHDLTSRGFSFLIPYRPRFKVLVAAFGTAPSVIYLGAAITHCEEVMVYTRRPDDSQDSATATKPMVLVGCQFTERLRR